MHYGPLPDGYTQVMNLRGGEIVELDGEAWHVSSVGYGGGIMALWVEALETGGAYKRVVELSPNMRVKLVRKTQ